MSKSSFANRLATGMQEAHLQTNQFSKLRAQKLSKSKPKILIVFLRSAPSSTLGTLGMYTHLPARAALWNANATLDL